MAEINKIFRRVRSKPSFIKENNKISSALFKDSKGVSVSVDGERALESIIEDEERLHELYHAEMSPEERKEREQELVAIASVPASECETKQVFIQLDPIKGENPFHAVLKRSEDVIELTKSQSKHLASKSTIEIRYDI